MRESRLAAKKRALEVIEDDDDSLEAEEMPDIEPEEPVRFPLLPTEIDGAPAVYAFNPIPPWMEDVDSD